jgi:hypothetical protein
VPSDLANHGPMGAEALAVLGHADQVAAWVEGYRNVMPHHEPPAPRFALDPGDESSWRPALGAFERAGDWERLFERAERPWRDVLARWWGPLLPGTLAGLTHGMIRTAHAVRSLSATPKPTAVQLTELARGLAYWAARYTGLPGEAAFTAREGEGRLADAVAALPRQPLPEGLSRRTAAERLRELDKFTGYREALGALAPADPQALLSDMTVEFAGVYLAHPEILPVPLIHAVTAPPPPGSYCPICPPSCTRRRWPCCGRCTSRCCSPSPATGSRRKPCCAPRWTRMFRPSTNSPPARWSTRTNTS